MRALFVKYSEIPPLSAFEGQQAKPIVVNKLGATIVTWKKGIARGLHRHPDEQIDFLLSGKIEWTVVDDLGERKEIMTAGGACGFEPNVAHGFRILEDATAVEIWCPADRRREDARSLGLVVSEQ